jgi:hypothetical protein
MMARMAKRDPPTWITFSWTGVGWLCVFEWVREGGRCRQAQVQFQPGAALVREDAPQDALIAEVKVAHKKALKKTEYSFDKEGVRWLLVTS